MTGARSAIGDGSWWRYLVVAEAAAVGAVVVPGPIGIALGVGVGLSAIAALLVGRRRWAGRHGRPWTVLAVALAACTPGRHAAQAPGEPDDTPLADTPPACTVTGRLIPSCGAWWGIAPEIFTGRDVAQALRSAEKRMGAPADIVHVYHRGKELFPTKKEIRLARDPEHPRLLLINWKPSLTHTWAEIARGAVDDRIDGRQMHLVADDPARPRDQEDRREAEDEAPHVEALKVRADREEAGEDDVRDEPRCERVPLCIRGA